jgi:hypothetical protein
MHRGGCGRRRGRLSDEVAEADDAPTDDVAPADDVAPSTTTGRRAPTT